MSRALTVLRFGLKVFGSRAFGVFLGLLALGWAFDKLVWVVTERSFFASVGLESWFWRQMLAPLALFGGFFGICLVLMRAFLRPLSLQKEESAPQLRGILARFGPLRSRISRIASILALVYSLLLARDFAQHGSEAISLIYGGRNGFGYLGLDASVWTRWLPLWMPFLFGIWRFSLVLGFLTALSGVLRFLPAIAERNSAPLALTRVLWRALALILALRALLYLSQTLDLPRGRPLETGDVLILAPLYVVGALWCALLSAKVARRSLQKVATFPARGQVSRAVFTSLAALFLPAFLGVISLPIRAVLPETSALKAERQRATRTAWRLPDEIAPGAGIEAPIERIWPVWDEAALLASRPRAGFAARRVIAWKSATLNYTDGEWRALMVGEGVGASTWNATREVEVSNALALEVLALGDTKARQSPANVPFSGTPVAGTPLAGTPLAIADAFFGLPGRALFAKSGGINVGSPALKWAWAWRERDLFLPVDAANSPHLLTRRGARERAGILAPWLSVAGEPRLSLEGQSPVWRLDLAALSPDFPGAMRGQSGVWARANSASAPFQMRMDARGGAVRFASLAGTRDAFSDDLRSSHPGIARENGSPQAGANLGRIQAEMLAALGETGASISGPARGLNARGEASWRITTIRKTGFELLEGAAPRPILTRGVGDLSARLSAIDAAIAQILAPGVAGNRTTVNPNAAEVQAATPFVWRDGRAPGGFWVGRAFFAAPRELEPTLNPAPQGGAPHGPLLWRVALTGSAADARVGLGESGAQAFEAATRPNGATRNEPGRAVLGEAAIASSSSASNTGAKPPLNSKALLTDKPGEPLEVTALRTHQEMQAAAKRGDWKAFGTLGARETALLQTLAARRQNRAQPAPKP